MADNGRPATPLETALTIGFFVAAAAFAFTPCSGGAGGQEVAPNEGVPVSDFTTQGEADMADYLSSINTQVVGLNNLEQN